MSQIPIAPLGCSLMEQSWGLVTFATLITYNTDKEPGLMTIFVT